MLIKKSHCTRKKMRQNLLSNTSQTSVKPSISHSTLRKKKKKKTQSLKIMRGKRTEFERLRSGCAFTVGRLSTGSSTTSSSKHSSPWVICSYFSACSLGFCFEIWAFLKEKSECSLCYCVVYVWLCDFFEMGWRQIDNEDSWENWSTDRGRGLRGGVRLKKEIKR
jgi:hypothetical protein